MPQVEKLHHVTLTMQSSEGVPGETHLIPARIKIAASEAENMSSAVFLMQPWLPDSYSKRVDADFVAVCSADDLFTYPVGLFDVVERDNIPASAREEGMFVFTVVESQIWQLVGGIDNSNWQAFDYKTKHPINQEPNILPFYRVPEIDIVVPNRLLVEKIWEDIQNQVRRLCRDLDYLTDLSSENVVTV